MIYKLQEDGLVFVEDRIKRGTQGWTREATVKWHGNMIRATVYRDSYDAQTRIHVDVFSPSVLEWHTVQSRSGLDHKYLPRSAEKDETTILVATESVILSLIAYTQQILMVVAA